MNSSVSRLVAGLNDVTTEPIEVAIVLIWVMQPVPSAAIIPKTQNNAAIHCHFSPSPFLI